MKIEIFKKKAKVFKKGGFHTNPDVAWEVVIFMVLALGVGILIYSIFLFRNIDSSFSVPEANFDEQSKIVNENRIDKVLEYFSLREERTNQILVNPAPFVDPSL